MRAPSSGPPGSILGVTLYSIMSRLPLLTPQRCVSRACHLLLLNGSTRRRVLQSFSFGAIPMTLSAIESLLKSCDRPRLFLLTYTQHTRLTIFNIEVPRVLEESLK